MPGTRLACRLLLLPCLVVGLSVRPAEHGGPVKREVIQGSYRNWTNQNSPCVSEDHYTVRNGLCCKKCPAGTRVTAHCQKDSESAKCQPCVAGEGYTEWENGLEKCLPCKTCREDQRQVSPCTPQKDTVCECEAGSFCTPDQACEVCQKCKTHCPEGEISKNCTPTSDTECETGKAKADLTSSGGFYLAVVITPIALILIVIFVLRKCKREKLCAEIMRKIKHKSNSADSEHQSVHIASSETVDGSHHRANETSVDTCISVTDTDIEQSQTEKTTLLQNSPEGPAGYKAGPVAKGYCYGNCSVSLPVGQGDDSLGQNEPTVPRDFTHTVVTSSLCHCQVDDVKTKGSSSSQNIHEVSPLAPCQGMNTQEARKHHSTDDESLDLEDLRQCFIPLVNEVPIKMWKQYMRKLSLTENEIETAEQDNNKNITEAHYQMLNTWLQKMGRRASVGILLNTLKEMDLNDSAHNVKTKIIEMKQGN